MKTSILALIIVFISTTVLAGVPRKVKRECKKDYKTMCPRYKVGTTKMKSCMRANGNQLSWGCYQALKDAGYVRRGDRRRR